jgi:acetyl esterase/lipase
MPIQPPPPAHTAPLPPGRPGPDGVRVLAGVPFASVPGARPIELDLYLPHDGPSPVVVFLHGGGWRLGSRHSAGPAFAGGAAFEQVAAAGVAVASADYRLSGEARWPAPLHDAKAAVRWLRARAEEIGIDPARIAVWGESAGGHLAELVALTGDGGPLEGDVGVTGPSSAVRTVVAWYAPSDLREVAADLGADPADPRSREAGLLGAPVPEVPELAAEASPVTHVRPGAPPFLLLHGAADTAIPCVQSERLAAALEAAGVDVGLHTYPGADHMWSGSPDAARDALDRTIEHLRRHLSADPDLANPALEDHP